MPVIAPSDYVVPSRNKRQIRTKQYDNFVRYNIVERRQAMNSTSFKFTNSNTDIRKHSFFPRTVIHMYRHRLDKDVYSLIYVLGLEYSSPK